MQEYPNRATAILAVALIVASGGCTSLAATEGETPDPLDFEAGQTVELGTLPPQALAVDECGLFLWTNSSEPRLVFAGVSGGEAHMVVNGEDLVLARNSAEGQEHYGQFELQSFYSPMTSVSLNMVIERRPAIVDGAVVPSATLRVTEQNGWETVIPVGGLIGCGAA